MYVCWQTWIAMTVLRCFHHPVCTVPEGAAVDDAVGGRESAVEVGGHAVRHDLGVRGQARALAPRAPAEAPAAVPPAGGDDIIIITFL